MNSDASMRKVGRGVGLCSNQRECVKEGERGREAVKECVGISEVEPQVRVDKPRPESVNQGAQFIM